MESEFRRGQPFHTTVMHHVVCQHRIEVEVQPLAAEVYFRDERFVDLLNTQVRFEAIVYNAPSSAVLWEVRDPEGGPGAGSIDSTGLYVAPPKGSLAHGTTDIIVATVAADPLRQAFARVTLVGAGPAPLPQPRVEIFPGHATLYYPANRPASTDHNEYIDASNKRQLFRAAIRHSDSSAVEWFVDPGTGYGPPTGGPEPWYLYQVTGSGNDGVVVKVKARLQGDESTKDEAEIILINYRWPDIA